MRFQIVLHEGVVPDGLRPDLAAGIRRTYCGVFGSRAGTIVLPSPKRRTVRAQGLRGLLATLWSWLLPPAQEEQP